MVQREITTEAIYGDNHMIDLQYASERREDFFNYIKMLFDDGVYVCEECGEKPITRPSASFLTGRVSWRCEDCGTWNEEEV